jgi:hypothetical protein
VKIGHENPFLTKKNLQDVIMLGSIKRRITFYAVLTQGGFNVSRGTKTSDIHFTGSYGFSDYFDFGAGRRDCGQADAKTAMSSHL